MMMQQHASVKKPSGGNWVRQAEHWIVRGGSLALSIVSGHAVYWFFSAMDGVDSIEPYMTWLTALAIGLLGYVILRGLTHRLMQNEKIRVYIPLCFILIGVETVSNFMKAVVGVHNDHWLLLCPPLLVQPMTYATYVVLSIMPAFTVFLAYVDMDLERATHAFGTMVSALQGSKAPTAAASLAPGSALKAVPPAQKFVPQQGTFPSAQNHGGQQPFSAIAPYPTSASSAPTLTNMRQVPTPAMQTAQVPPQGGVFNGLMNNAQHWASAANAQQVQRP